MKISSKDFYGGLRSVLAAPMKAAGFSVLKGGMLGWSRPHGEGYTNLWFQCDKWGWSERWGSRFTLEFRRGPEPGAGGAGLMTAERIGHLLEGFDSYDGLRLRNNAVIARLPGTLAGQAVVARLPDGSEYMAEGYVVSQEKLELAHDLWLHYHSAQDVQDWAAYFEQNMAALVSLYEDSRRSPLGEARARFNRALGAAQSAQEFGEKIALLEDYAASEPVRYWKAMGEYWLAQAKNQHLGAGLKAAPPRWDDLREPGLIAKFPAGELGPATR